MSTTRPGKLSTMLPENQLKDFDKWDVPRPTHEGHGSDDDIRANMKSVNPRNWRQAGNQLIADTDIGELVQTIPTTHLLDGTDENGLPKFHKVV